MEILSWLRSEIYTDGSKEIRRCDADTDGRAVCSDRYDTDSLKEYDAKSQGYGISDRGCLFLCYFDEEECRVSVTG